jgi:probable O-glycosylation ligase (exosortase A-associated)
VKQLLFMIAMTGYGVVGSLTSTPFIGFWVYVFYAVLRPQFMWQWSLPPGVNWSMYVALAAIGATVAYGPRPPAPAPGRWPASPVRVAPLHVAFFLFGLMILACYLTAHRPEVADLFMVDYGKLYVMFAVGVVVVRTVTQVWGLYLAYAVSLAYISYEINYLYFVNGYLGIQRNGFGGHDNNGAGMLLAMGVPLCAFAWEAYRGWHRWVFAALIPVIIHAVLMTYSRGAMVAMIIAAPLWILRGRYRKQKLLLGAAVLASVPFLAGNEIRERFFSIERAEADESANSRFTSWAIAWRITLENPILGVGVRNSPLLTYAYGADMEGRVIHSQYLQLSADMGLIGLALYLATVWYTLTNFQAVIRRTRDRSEPDAVRAYLTAAGFQGAFVTYLIGAVFLSCEAFEPQYWIMLAAAQLRLAVEAAPPPAPDRTVLP